MYKFNLAENNTTFFREIIAGCVTYAAMAYILCVQPAVMAGTFFGPGMATGMDEAALITATCLVCAIGSIAMGLFTRYPFAMAPGMGTNFFVVLELFPACAMVLGPSVGLDAVWMLGMAVVFAAGLLFFILSLFKVREQILFILSDSMKMAICAGIGLFIAFLGMTNATLIQIQDNQLGLGSFLTPAMAIFLTGFLVSSILMIRKFPGAILLGMFAASVVAYFVGELQIDQIMSQPADPMKVVGKLDMTGLCTHFWRLLPFIFILTFMDVFDAFGTFVGLGYLGGFFAKDGKLPRIERLFLADAGVTMFGAYCGHSTMTTYLESSAGIESGGRTGLVAVTVGVLFFLSLFFSPLIMAVGNCAPITASALILVGIMMMQSVMLVDWGDMTESIPAFFIVAGIPFFNSISNGILCGVVIYPILKISAGRWKEVKPGMYVLAILMLCYAVGFGLNQKTQTTPETPEAPVEASSVMEETPSAPILTDDTQKN